MCTTLSRTIMIVILAAPAVAFGQDGSHGDSRPLPPPSPNAPVYAAGSPAIPFERLGAQPGLMRTIFQGPGPGGSTIEIRELIVAARALVRLDPLPGPAIVDVRSGEGSLSAGDRSGPLAMSDVRSVASGVPLEFGNSGDVPLVVRIRLVEVR